MIYCILQKLDIGYHEKYLLTLESQKSVDKSVGKLPVSTR